MAKGTRRRAQWTGAVTLGCRRQPRALWSVGFVIVAVTGFHPRCAQYWEGEGAERAEEGPRVPSSAEHSSASARPSGAPESCLHSVGRLIFIPSAAESRRQTVVPPKSQSFHHEVFLRQTPCPPTPQFGGHRAWSEEATYVSRKPDVASVPVPLPLCSLGQ